MSDSELDGNLPGVGRLHFFLGKVGLIVASIVAVVYFGPESTVTRIVGLAAVIASFILDTMRIRNIGVSQWFVFLRYIPYVNLLYWIGLQSAQAGWGESRQLDRTGMTLAVFQLALLAILVFMIMRSGYMMPLPSLW